MQETDTQLVLWCDSHNMHVRWETALCCALGGAEDEPICRIEWRVLSNPSKMETIYHSKDKDLDAEAYWLVPIRNLPCELCGGDGADLQDPVRVCPKCAGSGSALK